MKNLFLCLVGILTSQIYAQAGASVTKDPFNLAVNKASKLLQKEQLLKLNESVNMYKEWRDTYKTVSQAIKQYGAVKEIYDYSKKLAAAYQMSVNEMNDNDYLSLSAKQKLMTVYTTALDDSAKKVEQMGMFISSMYQMNDAERISMLEKIKAGIKDDYSFILYVRTKTLSASKRAYNAERSKVMEKEITDYSSY